MNNETKNQVVYKSNELIQKFKNTFSLQEMKLINFIVSNINSPKYDDEFNTITVPMKILAKEIGYVSRSGKADQDIKDALASLSRQQSDFIEIVNKNGKVEETIVRWLERPRIDKETGMVTLKLDDVLKPYLLDLKKNYTKYELLFSIKMQSKYALKLYELLKSWEKSKHGRKEFDLDYLKNHIDAPSSYKNFNNFKTRVLDKALKEINDITELIVSYETITRGKKVTGLIFHISKKEVKNIPPVVTVPYEENSVQEKANSDLNINYDDFYKIAGLNMIPDMTMEKTKYIYGITSNILTQINPNTFTNSDDPRTQEQIVGFHVYQKVLKIYTMKEVKNKYGYLVKTLENEYMEVMATQKENEDKETSSNELPAWWTNPDLITNEEEYTEDDFNRDMEEFRRMQTEPVH